MSEASITRLPASVRGKVEETRRKVDALLEEARSLLRSRLPAKVTFALPEAVVEDLPTATERAQLITLVQRYTQLVDPPAVEVGKRPDRFYIANLPQLHHVLGDYRPFIQSSGGSLHYARLHTIWSKRLSGEGGAAGSIRVLDAEGREITAGYRRWLNDRKKAIAHVVGELDYSYVYEGILQHERPGHSDRFLREYQSGELNHVLWAHVLPLGFIRQMLWPYHRLARAFPLPEPGGL